MAWLHSSGGAGSQEQSSSQELAAAALSLLAQSADQNCGNREAVAQACAIDPLVALVLVGSAAAQVSAASALGLLASGEFDDFAPASQWVWVRRRGKGHGELRV